MAIPAGPGGGRRTVKRGPGRQIVEGASFRLADEVRHIQRRAADHNGCIVTIGQLVLFATETGDAWLLDRSDLLAAISLETGRPNRSTSRKPMLHSPSDGRAAIASRDRHSSTRIGRAAGSSPSLAIPPTSSLGQLSQEISNMFG